MNLTQQTATSEHQEVTLLLPWYVNKTLVGEEYKLVENHLKSCLVCKIEFANLEKLSASICQNDSLAPVAHASFMQLKNRIQQKNVIKKQNRERGFFSALLSYRQWFTSVSSKNWDVIYPSVIMTCLLTLTFTLISPAFFAEKQNSLNTFRTLSSTRDASYNQNEIRVVFANDITQEKIAQIISSVQGQIIAGPSPQGVFRIRIENKEINSTNLLTTLSLLRDNEQVIFSEPTFALHPQNNTHPGERNEVN